MIQEKTNTVKKINDIVKATLLLANLKFHYAAWPLMKNFWLISDARFRMIEIGAIHSRSPLK